MRLLSLFSSSVQMEHQRNLGYGFHGHRESISFVRRVVIEVCWGAGSVERFLFRVSCRSTDPVVLGTTIWYRGVCLPGVGEIQVIFGRLLCVRILLWRIIVDDLEKHASRACLWRWANDPGGSVMGTGSPGSFCLVQALYDGEASRHVDSGSVHVRCHRCGAHDSTGVEIMTVLESHNSGSFSQRWSMRFWIRPVVDCLRS